MSNASKPLMGCGGCSCLFSLLALPAGAFMLAMMNDSHMSELGPFGMVVTPLGGLAMMLGFVLLIAGFFVGKKAADPDAI
ncbi:MAG: hypothetical protein ACI8RZ_005978 [Myxococcota bacterium]|jgi:hypothetical protein